MKTEENESDGNVGGTLGALKKQPKPERAGCPICCLTLRRTSLILPLVKLTIIHKSHNFMQTFQIYSSCDTVRKPSDRKGHIIRQYVITTAFACL